MINAIGENIVELSVIVLVAFLIWGIGYLILTIEEETNKDRQQCISAQMQWISGSCVR